MFLLLSRYVLARILHLYSYFNGGVMDPRLHNYGLDSFVQSLNTFKALPANTFIHKDRHGNFIQTAENVSWIKGMQTITSYVKGQTSEQLAQDLNTYALKLIKRIDADLQKALDSNDENLKKLVYDEIAWISREFDLALQGKGTNGGLQGLVDTYKAAPQVKSSLEASINYMKINLAKDLQYIKTNLANSSTEFVVKALDEDEFTLIEKKKYKENLLNLTEELKFINASIQTNPQLVTTNQIKYLMQVAEEALPEDEWLTIEEDLLNQEIRKLQQVCQKKEKLVLEFCQKFDAVISEDPLLAKNIVDVLGLLEFEISSEIPVVIRLQTMKTLLGGFYDNVESWTRAHLLANKDSDQCLKGCFIFQHQHLRNDLQDAVKNNVLKIESIENRASFLAQIDEQLKTSNKNHLRSIDVQTSIAIAFHRLAAHYRSAGSVNKCMDNLEKAGKVSLLAAHPLGDIQRASAAASATGTFWFQVDGTAVRRRQVRVQMKTLEIPGGVNKQVLDLSFTLPRKEVEKMQEHLQLLNQHENYLKSKGILIDREAEVIYTASKNNVYQAEGKDSTIDKNLGKAVCFKDPQGRISVKFGQDPTQWNQFEKVSIKIDPSVTAQELHQFLSILDMPTVLLNSRFEDIMNENIARVANSYFPDKVIEYHSPEEWIAMGIKCELKDEIIDRAQKMSLKNLGLGKTEYVDKEATRLFIKSGGCGFGATIGFDSVSLSLKDIWYGDIYKKKSIEDSAWTLSLILKGGMMSTFERFERGFFGNGCCPEENIKVGAGNQVFVRPLTQNQFEQNHSWSDYAIEGNLFLMIDPSAAERLPYGYPVDRAGIRNKTHKRQKAIRVPQKEMPMKGLKGANVKDRIPITEICNQQMKDNRTLPTAEVLFEDVMPVSYITGAIVTSEADKAVVIKTLKDNNILSINGVPIEKCIYVSNSFDLRILERGLND